jgi:hypothetical protein
VLLPPDPSSIAAARQLNASRAGAEEFVGQSLVGANCTSSPAPIDPPADPYTATKKGRSHSISGTIQSMNSPNAPYLSMTPHDPSSDMTAVAVTVAATHRARRASAAEKVLEQLRSRSDIQKSGNVASSSANPVSTPRTSWIHFQQKEETPSVVAATASQNILKGTQSRSIVTPIGPPPSPVTAKPIALPPAVGIRPRPTWSMSPSQLTGVSTPLFPLELLALLDGEHHTDELSVRFEAGWPLLEAWLVAAGGGSGDGDFGRVCIIYR